MKITTYLAKFYDVNVRDAVDVKAVDSNALSGQEHVEIYEHGEDCEPIGWFIVLPDVNVYEWCNIYGKVKTGTVFTETELKQSAKAGLFYKGN